MTEAGEPAYRRVYRELESWLRSGNYRPGSRLPAEVQLAARLGVSRGTLRRALADLREQGRVDGTPGRGTFVRARRDMRPPGRRPIGVLVALLAKPHVAELLQGVEVEVHRRGYAMLLGSAGYSADQQAARVKRMLDQKVAALIAYPIDQEFDTALFENLVRRNIPLVLGDRYLPGLVVDTVVPDNVGGAYLAVAHLAALGHRRIAFVTTDNLATSSVAERLLGYRLALEANQGGYDPRLILSSPTTPRAWPAAPGPAAQTSARIAEFLERAAPTAVFALHDRLALDVYTAAAICGLRIPEDLSVVGFEDDLVASAASPALSTVAQPWEQMGRRMATMVLDRLEGSRDDADVLRLVLPTRLLIRASTAARKLSVSQESRFSPGG